MAYIVQVSSETVLLWQLQKVWEKGEKLLWIFVEVEHHLTFILLGGIKSLLLSYAYTHTHTFFPVQCTLQLPSLQNLVINYRNCLNSHTAFSSYLFSSASLTLSSPFHFCTWLLTLWSLNSFYKSSFSDFLSLFCMKDNPFWAPIFLHLLSYHIYPILYQLSFFLCSCHLLLTIQPLS